MKLWAFEHTPCIHESEFGLVSIHATKQGAEKAKEKYIQGVKDRRAARRGQLDPLADRASRIRKVTVED